jgi:hypothetical protein
MGSSNIELAIAKAQGFTISIGRMSAEQRSQHAKGSYGGDYNSLRLFTIEHAPSLKPLMPPEVEVFKSAMAGILTCRQSYSDIDTFCEQIVQLLTVVDN